MIADSFFSMAASYQGRDYLTSQLIAYIGNKRRLLGFLEDVFCELSREIPINSFIDPFAGSGAVSRLARSLGFQVIAGDLEEYSRVLVAASVLPGPEEAAELLQPWGGFAIYRDLQELGEGLGKSAPDSELPEHSFPQSLFRPFVSAHYAPMNTENADYRKERLFYTRENALFIDRVRHRIEEMIPGNPSGSKERLTKDLLLAPLLYGAATQANTSGVFKAFHKGFGGHGKDALGRILSPIRLAPPPLIDGPDASVVRRMAAGDLLRNYQGDLTYLDPPYNQHQYGSNYHLLNSIAFWDFPEPGKDLDRLGRLKDRGGIRKDWIKTRSAFCSPRTVRASFEEVLGACRSRCIALSYSDDGLLPLQELQELLEKQGRVSLYVSDYTVYRGGRQSPTKKGINLELLFLLDRLREYRGGWKPASTEGLLNFGDGEELPDGENVLQTLLAQKRIYALLKGTFSPERLKAHFPMRDDETVFLHDKAIALKTDRFYRFPDLPAPDRFAFLSKKNMKEIIEGLEASVCRDRQEEAAILTGFLDHNRRRGDVKRLGSCLRKLAHKKYADIWNREMARARQLILDDSGENARLHHLLDELEDLAARRFSG